MASAASRGFATFGIAIKVTGLFIDEIKCTLLCSSSSAL